MNPELVVEAAKAAIMAQQAAWVATILSVVMIIINGVMLGFVVWTASRVLRIEYHTNSMHDKLMVYGKAEGKAEEKAEESARRVLVDTVKETS